MYISSTTPLTGNAVYTSTSRPADRCDRIAGLVKADQAGTLFIEQSNDGTNWDLSKSIAVIAGTGQGYSEEIVGSFIRLRYVNGATPQGAFRLSGRMTSAGDS